jgi:hypothetical protein
MCTEQKKAAGLTGSFFEIVLAVISFSLPRIFSQEYHSWYLLQFSSQ